MAVHLVETNYTDQSEVAATYVVTHDDGVYLCETNTAYAVPAILAKVADLGFGPSDVTHIIITHIHLDHAGGASALMRQCPQAVLLAHPKAAPHAIDPSKIVAGATAVYGEAAFAKMYGTIGTIDASRVQAIDDGTSLDVGGHRLRFLHTRGHANHHMVIHDLAESAVFTGDSFGIAYPGLAGTLFPSTSPTDFDAEAALNSLDIIVRTSAQTAWLTHFGAIRDLPAAAAAMAPQLRAYGELVERLDASGREGADLLGAAHTAVDAFFDALVPNPTPAQRGLIDIDRDLNGQGVAVAVERRRFRRNR